MNYKETLEYVLEKLDLSVGQTKELDGMYEEIPGEVEIGATESIYGYIYYEVHGRLSSSTAIEDMTAEQIEYLTSRLTNAAMNELITSWAAQSI